MHELLSPRFVDPFWMNQIRQGICEVTVVDSRSVEVNGQVLYLAHPDEVNLSPAQEVFVALRDRFYLETGEERRIRQQEREQVRLAESEARRNRLNGKREEAESFNARLRVPVAWVPGFKAVLSGLSETSCGDGRNAATVDHILLQADLREGQLRRSCGDFLCASAQGKNGKRWVAPESVALDGEGNAYRPKVTCRACLRIARRWSS